MESVERFFGNDILFHTFVGLLIVLSSAILGKIVKYFLGKVVQKLFARTPTELDDRIARVLQSRIIAISISIGLFFAIQEVRVALTPEDVTILKILDYLGAILFVVVVVILMRLVIRLIDEWFRWYLERISEQTASNLATTVGPLASKVTNIIVLLVATVVILDHFGINIGSLLVSLGVGSLAVALAAQDTLSNMIAGFVIMIDRPFRIGDRVLLPSGEMGDVHEIGLRSTRILNFDNNLVIIPNAELVKNRIINYSYPINTVRILINVGVAYATDIEKAKYIMSDIAKNHPGILSDPIPGVYLVNFGESSVELWLVARTDDYRKKFSIETSLREKILKTFGEEGIEIPFPQRVIHMAAPTVNNGPQSRQKRKTLRR